MDHSFERHMQTDKSFGCSASLAMSPRSTREEDKRAQDRSTSQYDVLILLFKYRLLKDLPYLLGMQSCVRDTGTGEQLPQPEQEITALQTALRECWRFCNTLATLSTSAGGSPAVAWQSCWRLCQGLYEEYDRSTSEPLAILELCRDFSRALFEVRQQGPSINDSVLRVSFEMNNHLYTTHNQDLPQAFHERTLDFHVTLCHRMMKQGTVLPQETGVLLRACWALAESLFALRQIRKDVENHEKLFAFAVQACWDLCDLFRRSWSRSQPNGAVFRATQSRPTCGQSEDTPSSRIYTLPSSIAGSRSSYHDALTPITVIDDTYSPTLVSAPNIHVPGSCPTDGMLALNTQHHRWSGSVSTLGGYSASATSSGHTSSTATASTKGSYMERLQYLILKVAMNVGFCGEPAAQSFADFVKNLQEYAFGRQPWQMQLLVRYKRLVEADSSLRNVNSLPSKRLAVRDVAKAVEWLAKDEKWAWMRELFRLVCGIGPEEALRRGDTVLYFCA